MVLMSLSAEQEERPRHEEWACGHRGGLGGWNSHLHTTVVVYTQSCLTL